MTKTSQNEYATPHLRNGPDMPMFTDAIQKRLDAVRILRRQISELADNSAEDVERKALMLQNADQQTQRLP